MLARTFRPGITDYGSADGWGRRDEPSPATRGRSGVTPWTTETPHAHRDTVDVVGLGTQDSIEEAHAFVREHGLRTLRMLYDPSPASRQQPGSRGQPQVLDIAGRA